jgi:ankyrin repeat protein
MSEDLSSEQYALDIINNISDDYLRSIKCSDGSSILMAAIYHGKTDLVNFMLEYRLDSCDIDYITEHRCRSATTCAVRKGRETILRKLLEMGCRLVSCGVTSDNMKTYKSLLDYSSQRGENKSNIAMVLLDFPEQSGLDKINNDGSTPLIYAIRNKMSSVALRMLDYPDLCNMSYIYEDTTAFLLACRNKLADVVIKMLIYPEQCNLGFIDKFGMTALMWACVALPDNICMKFTEYLDKCNTNHIKNAMLTNSAIHIACLKNKPQIALRLLSNINEKTLSYVSNTGYTPLMLACKNKMWDVVNEMIKYPLRCNITYSTKGISAITEILSSDQHDLVRKISGIIKKIKLFTAIKNIYGIDGDITMDRMEEASEIIVVYGSRNKAKLFL